MYLISIIGPFSRTLLLLIPVSFHVLSLKFHTDILRLTEAHTHRLTSLIGIELGIALKSYRAAVSLCFLRTLLHDVVKMFSGMRLLAGPRLSFPVFSFFLLPHNFHFLFLFTWTVLLCYGRRMSFCQFEHVQITRTSKTSFYHKKIIGSLGYLKFPTLVSHGTIKVGCWARLLRQPLLAIIRRSFLGFEPGSRLFCYGRRICADYPNWLNVILLP